MSMDSPTGEEVPEEGAGLTTAGVPDFFDGKDPTQFAKDLARPPHSSGGYQRGHCG